MKKLILPAFVFLSCSLILITSSTLLVSCAKSIESAVDADSTDSDSVAAPTEITETVDAAAAPTEATSTKD